MNKPNSWSDKSDSNYELAVVIGRFQPFHNGHAALINEALHSASQVLVLVGSAFQAPSMKNPFTFEEREKMILGAFPDHGDCITVEGVSDCYNDEEWLVTVQQIISDHLNHASHSVVIVGHQKDHTSYYLDKFPGYGLIKIPEQKILLHSTDIRQIVFEKGMIPANVMPENVFKFIEDYMKTVSYKNIREDHLFITDYRKKHKYVGAPYDPIFVTTDAVVVNNGHVLLVKRRMSPGKGLWALPGGFLNPHERIIDGMIRELEEETRIKISTENLYKAIRNQHVFDDPLRSNRGRIVTHAFFLQLYEKKLPKVRGSDDAERAKWFPIADFLEMQSEIYEDHFQIVKYFVSRAG